MTRWFMSLAWVVAPGATSTARSMSAFGVADAERLPLGATAAGAPVIAGRGPLNRYGGE